MNKPTTIRREVCHVCNFPDWFDDKGRMAMVGDTILIIHPNYPPHKWNASLKVWEEICFKSHINHCTYIAYDESQHHD